MKRFEPTWAEALERLDGFQLRALISGALKERDALRPDADFWNGVLVSLCEERDRRQEAPDPTAAGGPAAEIVE